jgi:hypothetical protein
MIAADDLISLVRNYNPKPMKALIRGAYDYGRAMHEGQFGIPASRISPTPSPSPPS